MSVKWVPGLIPIVVAVVLWWLFIVEELDDGGISGQIENTHATSVSSDEQASYVEEEKENKKKHIESYEKPRVWTWDEWRAHPSSRNFLPKEERFYPEPIQRAVNKRVAVVQWPQHIPFDNRAVHEIVMTGEPVIFRGTPVVQSKAMSLFSPSFLSSELSKPLRPFVKAQRVHNTFWYSDPNRPFATFSDAYDVFDYNQNAEYLMDCSASEFFNGIDRDDSPVGYYYSSYLSELGELASLVNGTEILEVRPTSTSDPHTQGDISRFLWMGGRGVFAQLHYDMAYNFFIQLHGEKDFILFPSSEHTRLYMYPSIHPYYRQSQVNFSAPDPTLFPDIEKLRGVSAHVEPGDLMYLPPMWFHHVRAPSHGASISVNVWTGYEERRVLEALMEVGGIPRRYSWEDKQLVIVSKLYISSIIESVCLLQKQRAPSTSDVEYYASPSSWVRHILLRRYQPQLVEPLFELADPDHRTGRFCAVASTPTHPDVVHVRKDMAKSPAGEQLHQIEALFTQFSFETTDLHLANYLDEILHKCIRPENVGAFWAHCF